MFSSIHSVIPAALPRPPTSLVISDVTATSLRLKWNSGNTDPIESYTIQYKPKYARTSVLFEEIPDITGSEYTVTGLKAYTVY